jgi:type VI secretion system secreted protein VgrG
MAAISPNGKLHGIRPVENGCLERILACPWPVPRRPRPRPPVLQRLAGDDRAGERHRTVVVDPNSQPLTLVIPWTVSIPSPEPPESDCVLPRFGVLSGASRFRGIQSSEGSMTRRRHLLLPLLILAFAGGDLLALNVTLTTPLGGDAFVVEGFHGQEGISRLYSFTIDLAAARGRDVPFDALLGEEVSLDVPLPDGSVRHFNGIVSRFSAGDADIQQAHYHLDLAPKASLLMRRQTSRIFQEQTVPHIVSQILGSVPGLAFEMRLTGTYPPRNYVVQRNESDFAFISRLLEEEGIAYYFTHGTGGHVMILTDAPQGFGDLPAVHPYRPGALAPPLGVVTSWEKAQEIRSGKVTLGDRSFEIPGQDFEAQATIQESVLVGSVEHHLAAGGGDALELFEFPGGYAQRFDGVGPAGEDRSGDLAGILPEGRRLAGIRMQEEAARALEVGGKSTAPDLTAGSTISIAGLGSQFNGKYLVTGVKHNYTPSRNSSGGYTNEIRGIPTGLPYRPPRTTPKPVMPGVETAVVVALPGEEVTADKYGRVKVRFPWLPSEPGQRDDTTSGWIRVASPWAGAGTGTGSGPVIIPRVGWEVVVAFEGGDPDRPIIVGSVYNADHLPPLDQ